MSGSCLRHPTPFPRERKRKGQRPAELRFRPLTCPSGAVQLRASVTAGGRAGAAKPLALHCRNNTPVERGLAVAVELLELVGLDEEGELYTGGRHQGPALAGACRAPQTRRGGSEHAVSRMRCNQLSLAGTQALS